MQEWQRGLPRMKASGRLSSFGVRPEAHTPSAKNRSIGLGEAEKRIWPLDAKNIRRME